jgi:hypothetical protein
MVGWNHKESEYRELKLSELTSMSHALPGWDNMK